MYAMVLIRLDISHVISVVSKYMASQTKNNERELNGYLGILMGL